jgi:hypothetical protein
MRRMHRGFARAEISGTLSSTLERRSPAQTQRTCSACRRHQPRPCTRMHKAQMQHMLVPRGCRRETFGTPRAMLLIALRADCNDTVRRSEPSSRRRGHTSRAHRTRLPPAACARTRMTRLRRQVKRRSGRLEALHRSQRRPAIFTKCEFPQIHPYRRAHNGSVKIKTALQVFNDGEGRHLFSRARRWPFHRAAARYNTSSIAPQARIAIARAPHRPARRDWRLTEPFIAPTGAPPCVPTLAQLMPCPASCAAVLCADELLMMSSIDAHAEGAAGDTVSAAVDVLMLRERHSLLPRL